MSKYPEWWNTTVTVFNKYEDPTSRQITWYKTVIKDCFWKNTDNAIVVGETSLVTSATICRIPKQIKFIDKYKWDALSNKSCKFTLSPDDILVRGSVADVIDEYTPGQRSSDLLAKYKKLQNCMVIRQCALNTGEGRSLEHYYVKGV